MQSVHVLSRRATAALLVTAAALTVYLACASGEKDAGGQDVPAEQPKAESPARQPAAAADGRVGVGSAKTCS